MKRLVTIFAFILMSTLVCLGQDSMRRYTSLKDLIQREYHDTYNIKARFSEVFDSSQLIFFVEQDDYIIPVRLEKKDLGAEKRFQALNLKEGDVLVVKGTLRDILVGAETYKGLADAIIVSKEAGSGKNTPATTQQTKPAYTLQTEPDESEEEEIVHYLDVEPKFLGQDKNAFAIWVNSRLQYPDIAKENGIQGRVTLEYTIEKDGRVTNVHVLRGVDPLLDKEAIRVVSSSPRWSPGYMDGKPVRVTYTFPVIFQLR